MLTLLKLRKFTLAWIIACAALLAMPNIADAGSGNRGRAPQHRSKRAKKKSKKKRKNRNRRRRARKKANKKRKAEAAAAATLSEQSRAYQQGQPRALLSAPAATTGTQLQLPLVMQGKAAKANKAPKTTQAVLVRNSGFQAPMVAERGRVQSNSRQTGNSQGKANRSQRRQNVKKNSERFGRLMGLAYEAFSNGDRATGQRYMNQARELHFNGFASAPAYEPGPIVTPAPAASGPRPSVAKSTGTDSRRPAAKRPAAKSKTATTSKKSRNERLAQRYYNLAKAKKVDAQRTKDPKKARQLLADANALEAKAKKLDPSYSERAPRLATREIRERTREIGKELGQAKAEHKRALRQSRELKKEAEAATGDQAVELTRNSRVRKAQGALHKADMLRLQADGLELKSQSHTNTRKAAKQLAKAERYRNHAEKIEAAVERFAEKHKLMEQPAGAAEQTGQAPSPEAVGAAQATSPEAAERKTIANASVGLLKDRLSTGNLAAATDVAKQMEVDAKDVGGLRGVWKRMRLRRARRLLRKGANALAKADVQNGTLAAAQQQMAANDASVAQFKTQDAARREGLKAEADGARATVNADSEMSAADKAKAHEQINQQEAAILAGFDAEAAAAPQKGRPANNFDQARKTLAYLATKEASYEGKPVRRVLSNMWRVVRGSTARSNRKLDRVLLKEIGRQSGKKLGWKFWRGLKTRHGIDGALAAQALIATAKTEGLNVRKTRRFNRLRKKAIKSTQRAIRESVKGGDPAAVEAGHTLLKTYSLETGEKFQVSPKELAKMNKQMVQAEVNFISTLIKQAHWLYKWRGKLQHMGDTGEMAKGYAASANQRIDKMMDNGIPVPSHLKSALKGLRIKVGMQKRHGAVRALAFLAKPVTLPLKFGGNILKFFTVTQYRALRYPATQGVPNAPVEQGRMQMLLERNMSEAFQNHNPGAMAQAQQGGPEPFDPMGLQNGVQ